MYKNQTIVAVLCNTILLEDEKTPNNTMHFSDAFIVL
jgi:hypothetical protein